MALPSTHLLPLTGDALLDVSLHGSRWVTDGTKTINWSISDGFFGEFWNNPANVIVNVDIALSIFSTYIDVKFQYTGYHANPTLANNAGSNINISLDGSGLFFSSSSQWARGHFPENLSDTLYVGQSGDIYINLNSEANFLPTYDPGSQGWFLLIHELGHALGLKHTHDDGGTGGLTLQQLGLGGFDIDWFSIMSYEDNFASNLINYDPASPMPLDVIGLQYLYGKNQSNRAGTSTTDVMDFNNLYGTVWDSGGANDTVTAVNSSDGWLIQLPNLDLSPLNGEKFGYAVKRLEKNTLTTSSTLAPTSLIHLQGDFENATGSNNHDDLFGNHLNNTLRGLAGDDDFKGGGGSDLIFGGVGLDLLKLTGNKSQYSVAQQGGSIIITDLVPGRDGTATVQSIEFFEFADGTVTSSNLLTPDIPGDTSTTATLSVGESVTSDHTNSGGTIDLYDYFAMSLIANNTYEINLEGSSTQAGTLDLPLLQIYDQNNGYLTGDFGGGVGNNAKILFTPTSTATYFAASKGGANFEGTYKISLSLISSDTKIMTSSQDILISSSITDVLDINQVASVGVLEVDLGNIDDQIILYNGSNNSGFVKGFENILADGYSGSFGAQITGSAKDNTIIATSNADTLNGLGGNDIITGGGGNDNIVGGAGRDTATFFGFKSEYTFQEFGKAVIISDLQSGRDGADTLSGIENYEFSDGTFQLSDLLNPTNIDRGIYRFFNVDTGTHFLSGSTVERDSVINNLDAFNYEGSAFRAADPTNTAADTVFRFFNTQTGTHFFTQSTVERDNILETLPHFSFEGEAYKGYTEPVDGSIPLYRFFNTHTGTHFYTAAEAEKDNIIDNLPTFDFEGTAYWVDPVMG